MGRVLRRRRIFLLGALPPLITSVIFLALLITLIGNLRRLIPVIAGFSDGWAGWLQVIMEVAIGIGLVGGSILIMVLVFTAVTLAIGAPAYEKIAELVDREFGELDEQPGESVPGAIRRGIGQTLTMLLLSILGAIIFALLGFVPIIGQVAAPVLSAIFGSWLLGIELLGPAFERRGVTRLADRRAAMGEHRMLVLGFAVPTFLLMAIPFLSVLVFPAATAGATLLARRLRGEPVTPSP